jgi:hypothetical protein
MDRSKYLLICFLLASAACKQQDSTAKQEGDSKSLSAITNNNKENKSADSDKKGAAVSGKPATSLSNTKSTDRVEIPFTLSPLKAGEDASSILGTYSWLPLKGKEKEKTFSQKNLNDRENFPFTACIITTKGALKCGTNSQLAYVGNGSLKGPSPLVEIFSAKVSKVAVGSNHICAIVDSALYCWGGHMNNPSARVRYMNPAYLLGNGTSSFSTTPILIIPSGVTDVSVSAMRTCAVVNTTLKCWGDNRNPLGQQSIGEIGDGSKTPYTAIPQTVIASGVTSVDVRAARACAVADNNLMCWGNGVATPTKITSLAGVSNWSAGRGRACLVKNGALLCNYQHNDPNNSFYKTFKNPNPVIYNGSLPLTVTRNGVVKQYTLSYGPYVVPEHDFLVVPGYETGVKQVYVSEYDRMYVLHSNGSVSYFNDFSFAPIFLQGTNAIVNTASVPVFTSLTNIEVLSEAMDQSPCVKSGFKIKCGIGGLHSAEFDLPAEAALLKMITY